MNIIYPFIEKKVYNIVNNGGDPYDFVDGFKSYIKKKIFPR